jgi:predicted ATPase/class 3 adenylate cyclase
VAERVETLALLFTDIEGSTNLLRSLGADYRTLLAEHRRLLRDAFGVHGGAVFGVEGDALFVGFDDPASAILAAVDGQLALAKTRWLADAQLRVRMGIHVGEVIIDADDHVGLAVHQASRIAGAAHGGQVLISDATRNSTEKQLPRDISLKPLGRFRLKDFPEPQDLYQLHHPDLPQEFPAPRTAPGARHNLPRAISSFIGRDREVAEVAELLERSRLVTLTGPGGCGKTRLALEAASASIPVRPDGIWFVDLAPVSDAGVVLPVAAKAMGVQDAGSTGSAVIDFLSPGRPLVILDNCEHLIATCAELTEDWLSSCPGLTVLVTAREPIGVAGEVIHRVGGLQIPPEGEADQSAEAVQLFVERANAHDPEFEPTDKELVEIGQLSRRLDGIPLAIEMAAALVGTLAVGEIVSRLDDRFRLLTGGGGRTLGRQQTLLATVDWSHELLSEPERVLLRRLSVMSGSFSLDDVEAVCAGDGIDRSGIVSLLRRLVTTSWVMRERTGEYALYRLLETSRQYALDKLVASSETQRLRTKHCEWFTELAETASLSLLGGPDQAAWLDRVEVELDNFRTALAWSLSDGDPTLGLRLGAALSRFWEIRGHWAEGLDWLERALARAPDADDRLRGRALVAASFLAFYRGQLESARSKAQEGLAGATRSGDRATEARGLRFAAVIEQRLGNLPAALEAAEKAVAVSRSSGEPADLAFALQVLGRLLVDEDREEARARYEEGLEVARAAEDAVSQIYLLYALGRLWVRDDDNNRARNLYSEALHLAHQVGERWMAMNVLVGLSQVSEEVDAGSALEEMVGVVRQTGNRMMQIVWLRQLAYRRRLEGDLEGAKRAVEEARAIVGPEEGTSKAKALGHYILGSHLDEAEHDYAGALVEFRQGVGLAHSLGSEWETTFGLAGVGRMLALNGEHAQAAVVLGAAERIQEKVGMRPHGPRAEVHQRVIEEIGQALGEPERDRLRAEGRALSLEDAVALATKDEG